MLVEDVLSRDVVTVDVDATLHEAAHEMLSNNVGSAVVTVDATPAGIVTEYDVTWAGYKADRPFSEIPVRKVASQPLETIQPSATLHTAADRMQSANVKRLVVAEGTELVGIVTMTDIVHHHSDLLSVSRSIAQQREAWTSK
jgi:CBS domain-containing protein